MYRAALVEAAKGKKREDGPEVLEELKASQLVDGKRDADPRAGRKWTLLMFGGGHFAGMVVSLVPRLVSRGKGKEKEREVVIIEKKTFHRYTSAFLRFDRGWMRKLTVLSAARRKQGGSQAANDNAKGKASSAGAQIRRHNEMALTEVRSLSLLRCETVSDNVFLQEVQALLTSWRDEIQGSELVFLRASKTNHKTFFGFPGAPIDKSAYSSGLCPCQRMADLVEQRIHEFAATASQPGDR